MQKIRRDEARPSMVIASTVRGEDGDIPFMKGIELTEGAYRKGLPNEAAVEEMRK